MAKKQIATFLGPNKGLSILEKHAYAYSGLIEDAASGSAASTCFDFRTGKSYVLADLNWLTDYQGGNDTYIDILLNGESIFKGTYDTDPHVVNDQPVRILIPPLTHFEFKWPRLSLFQG